MFDFSLTEEQELLVEQVEEFMKRGNYDDYFKECDRERKYPERRAGTLRRGFSSFGLP